MKMRARLTHSLCLAILMSSVSLVGANDEFDSADEQSGTIALQASPTANTPSRPKGSASGRPKQPPHAVVLKDFKRVPGVITTYHKGNRMFMELTGNQYANEYIVLISIAKGIGQGSVLGGMSWNFGDDTWIWRFRKIDKSVHIVRRNVRFRAAPESPEATAVQNAYSDSVLFSLPIVTKGPQGGDVIDVTSVFMSDLPQISRALPGFSFSPTKSTWHKVKGFPKNIELQVAATYVSSGARELETVIDSRGVTINVHYSLSKVPSNGYKPRLADDRVGYFLTVVKDYSKQSKRDRFVRYANRWDLKKKDPSLAISPPQKPIEFYLEKTIPIKYRQPITEGIEEWNKAFKKIGFFRAIRVMEQTADDSWDPEDVRFNTFRWITSGAGFAMGPSRVNPYTGQILDADIIFDADFIQSWKNSFETFTEQNVASMTGGPLDLKTYNEQLMRDSHHAGVSSHGCMLSYGMSRQIALAQAAIVATAPSAEQRATQQNKLIMQGLKEVAMHEVGHTLGLRHNFKASAMLSLDELNDAAITGKRGMVASVMDYLPANIAAKNDEQRDYYPTTIGPYDYWAIEYGYKPVKNPAELVAIASRSGEPELAYATDEEVRGIDPDPLANRFDLGNDPIAFAKQKDDLVVELIPGIVDRMTEEGDNYSVARRTFNVLMATQGQAMHFASRNVGGIHMSRSHKGDKGAGAPFEVVSPEKQREALSLLEQRVFGIGAYQFPVEIYNHLGASRWRHWGTTIATRPDFPIHESVLLWQNRILSQLTSSLTLSRIHDTELKVSPDEDAFTTAELLESLTTTVFSEIDNATPGDYSNRKPAISSLRRNLQRAYLKQLARLTLGNTAAPDDCQTIAYAELASVESRIRVLLAGDIRLDSYSRAHLQASAGLIRNVLDAKLERMTL